MSAAITMAEGVVRELKQLQERLEGTDAVAVFQVRRKLEKAIFEHHKQGERIPLRTSFELRCEVCGVEQDNEDQYYLHLRKAHKIADHDAVDKANKQRGDYTEDVQNLRRLLTQYTDFDLEDEFTRGFTGEEENTCCDEHSDNTEAYS
jgi:hypothetical protein